MIRNADLMNFVVIVVTVLVGNVPDLVLENLANTTPTAD